MSRPFPSFWLYKDANKQWRWTFHAGNGLAIAVSSESYINRSDCQHGIDLLNSGTAWPVWMPSDLVHQH